MTEPQPPLRHAWAQQAAVLRATAAAMLDTAELTDVLLAAGAGDTLVPAHRLVLAAASPFFRQLFRKLGPGNTVICLKDVDPGHLQLLLQFMYRGEVSIQQSDLGQLLETARSLDILGFQAVAQKDYTNFNKYKNQTPDRRQIPKRQKLGSDNLSQNFAWSGSNISIADNFQQHGDNVASASVEDTINNADIKTEVTEEAAEVSEPAITMTPLPPPTLQQMSGPGPLLFPDPQSFCSQCNEIFDKRANPLPCFKCNLWFHLKCRCRHNC